MRWEELISVGLIFWTAVGLFWWVMAVWMVRRAFERQSRILRSADTHTPLPVSVFKSLPPLHGKNPSRWVIGSLRLLAGQLDAEDECLFGYRAEDEAVWQPVLDGLVCRATVRQVPVRLGEDLFHNRKVVALYQMARSPGQRQKLWFWSDADIRLPEGAWKAIKEEWRCALAPAPAALTFPYRLVHTDNAWGGLEALYVNAEFLPGVQAAGHLARDRQVAFSLGAGILFDGTARMTPELWDDLSRDLADDFRLGQQLGPVTLSRLILDTEASETGPAAALNHYLRWHKTVRWSQPAGYFGQGLLLPLLGWAGAWLADVSGFLLPGAVLMLWLWEMGAGYALLRLAGAWRLSMLPWLPVWPLLRAGVWLSVWLPWPVAWRNNLWWHRRRKTATYPIMSEATPHPALKPHYQSLEEKQIFLRQVFDAAAPFYEGIASWGFFGSGPWYRRTALQRCGLKPGMKTIDVAAGTGPTARAVAEVVGSPDLVTAVEPSEGMLKESMKRLDCVHHQAPAEVLPVGDGEYDYLTMGFALRHVDNLEQAFREYFRVLKPGATACVLDLTMPQNPVGRFLVKLYFKHILPLMTRVITGNKDAEYLMAYYWDTLEQMVPREEVVRHFESAGFTDVKHHVVIGMFSEYTARKPA